MDCSSNVSQIIKIKKNQTIHGNYFEMNRVTYIIRELVENYEAHPQYIDDVDWFFMPLINPDGYEFSHTNVDIV